MSKLSFEDWMRQVNLVIGVAVGCDSSDLPDIDYSTMWEDGVSPKTATRRAIRNAGE